jgi:hypothetical protein
VTPILGFTPDLDTTIEGVLVDCQALVPSLKGMKAAPSDVPATLAAPSASEIKGATLVEKLDGSTRFLAADSAKIYEATSPTAWTERGSGYSSGTLDRWRFAQFGNVALAVNKSTRLQASVATTFEDAATAAPKASIVETVDQFVFLLDTNETTYGDQSDRWWCSGIGDYTDWVPAISSQCTTGRLLQTNGPIRAGRRLGGSVVVYKERAVYLGTYVGPPIVWDFREVSNVAGALSHEVVVPVVLENGGYMHFFMGADDFFAFDGSRPVSIGSPLREWVFSRLNRTYTYRCMAYHNQKEALIYWAFPTTTSICDTCVVYNYRTNKWGRDDRSVEAFVNYASPGLSYGDLGSAYSTYGDLTGGLLYGTAFPSGAQRLPSFFNTAHEPRHLTGPAAQSSFTTGDYGTEVGVTTVNRIQPRWSRRPVSASVTNAYRMQLGDPLQTDQTVPMVSARFDLMRAARWHRFTFSMSGEAEFPAVDFRFSPDGEE